MERTHSPLTDTREHYKRQAKQAAFLVALLLGVGCLLILSVVGCFVLGPWPFMGLGLLVGIANWLLDHKASGRPAVLSDASSRRPYFSASRPNW